MKSKKRTKVEGGTTSLSMPYELTFVGGYGDDDIEADLTSPLLDAILHPKGILRVIVTTDSSVRKGKPRFMLDAFHVHSLHEYLRSQAVVRKTLEAALAKDRKDWGELDDTAGKPLWECGRMTHLNLRRRRMATPEFIAQMRKIFSPKEIREELAGLDTPETQTAFTVVLECDWDEEHSVVAEFQDGAFVGLNHE
jgi:hypothetical protein